MEGNRNNADSKVVSMEGWKMRKNADEIRRRLPKQEIGSMSKETLSSAKQEVQEYIRSLELQLLKMKDKFADERKIRQLEEYIASGKDLLGTAGITPLELREYLSVDLREFIA